MEITKQKIRKSKLLIPTLLLVGLISGIVVAQLLSNRIQQDINIKGIDGQIVLTASTTIPSSEWFGESVGLNIVAEKLRPVGGYMYLWINNTDLNGITPEQVTLALSHRNADGSAYDSSLEQTTTIVDSNCIQFKETLRFSTGEDICGYNFAITWKSSVVSGNYSVSVFVEDI